MKVALVLLTVLVCSDKDLQLFVFYLFGKTYPEVPRFLKLQKILTLFKFYIAIMVSYWEQFTPHY